MSVSVSLCVLPCSLTERAQLLKNVFKKSTVSLYRSDSMQQNLLRTSATLMCSATHRHTDTDTPTCSPQCIHHKQTHAESLMHTHPTIPICSIKMQVHSHTQGFMDVQLQALTEVQTLTKAPENLGEDGCSWQLQIASNVAIISLERNSCINKAGVRQWDGTTSGSCFWAQELKSHAFISS